jgi:hypothetical protein
MATFFQAWRRRQANQHVAEWEEELEEARRAVERVPPPLRADVRSAIETLIDGPDAEVAAALDELRRLLEPYPELTERFASLRVVDDAVDFLRAGSGLAFGQAAERPDRDDEMQDLTPGSKQR